MFEKIWSWHKQPKATSSPYIEAIARFNQIPIPESSIYQDIGRIDVLFPNIDLYSEVLQRANESLQSERAFSYLGYEPKFQRVQRKAFYLNRDGYFIDLEQWHNRFIDKVEIFLSSYEEKSNKENNSVVMMTTLQRLLPMANNLIELSIHLSSKETPMK